MMVFDIENPSGTMDLYKIKKGGFTIDASAAVSINKSIFLEGIRHQKD